MSISSVLRREVRDAQSLYATAKGTGLPYSVVHAFNAGGEVKLRTADTLAAYFGYRLIKKTSRRE